MWARLSIVVGLLVRIAAAGLILGGIFALAPETPQPVPAASGVVESTRPSSVASDSPSATPAASPSASTATSSSAAGAAGAAFHVGQPAPPLVLPRVGGGTIDLASLRGKPVWVNFMATWCPSCQDEFPLMKGFATRYADTGLTVVAADVREDDAAVAAFAKGLGVEFPLGLDTDGKAAKTWDAIALPVHFWIDAEGIVRHGALGGIGPDVMVDGLKTILPGVDVTP